MPIRIAGHHKPAETWPVKEIPAGPAIIRSGLPGMPERLVGTDAEYLKPSIGVPSRKYFAHSIRRSKQERPVAPAIVRLRLPDVPNFVVRPCAEYLEVPICVAGHGQVTNSWSVH